MHNLGVGDTGIALKAPAGVDDCFSTTAILGMGGLTSGSVKCRL